MLGSNPFRNSNIAPNKDNEFPSKQPLWRCFSHGARGSADRRLKRSPVVFCSNESWRPSCGLCTWGLVLLVTHAKATVAAIVETNIQTCLLQHRSACLRRLPIQMVNREHDKLSVSTIIVAKSWWPFGMIRTPSSGLVTSLYDLASCRQSAWLKVYAGPWKDEHRTRSTHSFRSLMCCFLIRDHEPATFLNGFREPRS